MNHLTSIRLKSLLKYNSITGIFTWKIRRRNGVNVGDEAGYVNNQGYVMIGIYRRQIGAHRLAWLYMTGHLPSHQLDHKNGIRNDNSWKNIRKSSPSHNLENQRKARSNSSTGLLGVKPFHGNFVSNIRVRGKVHYLGHFSSAIDAHKAYVKAKRKLHEGCTI